MTSLIRKIGLQLMGFVLCSLSMAQEQVAGDSSVTLDADSLVFVRYVASMPTASSQSMAETVVQTARFFLGTPYVGATLEQEPEQLVVNLRAFDCTTFVENVLALSRVVRTGQPSFANYRKELARLRYRTDQITDYTDRLHYTTDWMYENARRGVVVDCTQQAGGIPLPLKLNFMSTHVSAYKQLVNHPEWVVRIQQIESSINQRSYYYLPQDSIESNASAFHNGDIVCFVTSIEGLDIAHLGIVCWQGEKLTFIHASSSGKQVMFHADSLSDYVRQIKKDIGVMLWRPLP